MPGQPVIRILQPESDMANEKKEEKVEDENVDKEVATLTEEKAAVTEEGATTIPPTAAARDVSLLEETKFYYRQSICLRCDSRKRNVVCLPCCHLTLCSFCSVIASRCYRPDCKVPIESTIETFIG